MLSNIQANIYDLGSYTKTNDILLYIDYLKNKYEIKTFVVTPDVAYRHQGNLFGLFKHAGIDARYHVFTMYMNNLTNPTQYDGINTVFNIPNFEVIEHLLLAHS